jgi:L-fuculose-phosphate aldolase
MAQEKYIGVKFQTFFLGKFLPTQTEKKLIKSLISAGKEFGRLSIKDKNGGNISVRSDRGVIIRRTGAYPYQLKLDDFVLVTKVRGNKVWVSGELEPSSEARLHYNLYQSRPDINCILHAHDFLVVKLKKKIGDIGYVGFKPYGTLELARAVRSAVKNHNYLIQENHGVIALGPDIKSALSLIKYYHAYARKLNK